jgi:hypothetical protein
MTKATRDSGAVKPKDSGDKVDVGVGGPIQRVVRAAASITARCLTIRRRNWTKAGCRSSGGAQLIHSF